MDAKANTHLCPSPVAKQVAGQDVFGARSAYVIVISGGIPGKMIRLSEAGTSLGRSADSSFQVSDITVSRRHASIAVDEAGAVRIQDEGSTNGTRLNGKRLDAHRPVLMADGDRILLGTTFELKLVQLDQDDERFQLEMFERTVRDSLTGLYNRAYLLDQIGILARGARGRAWGWRC